MSNPSATQAAETPGQSAVPANAGVDLSSSTLKLWSSVHHTDPAFTKDFSFPNGFVGTSIIPMYQLRKATEVFGPFGLDWGVEVLNETYVPGRPLSLNNPAAGTEIYHKVFIELWYLRDGRRGSVKNFGVTQFLGVDQLGVIISDEDHPKKSMTDAISKCLSFLGFSADVYMGMFQDSKYVAAMRERFASPHHGVAANTGASGESGAGDQSVPTPEASTSTFSPRYMQYKARLAETDVKPILDMAACIATIEQDQELVPIEKQMLLATPVIKAHSVDKKESPIFL